MERKNEVFGILLKIWFIFAIHFYESLASDNSQEAPPLHQPSDTTIQLMNHVNQQQFPEWVYLS